MKWYVCFTFVGKIFHWLTGWLAHPEKGGCCDGDFSVKSDIDNMFNK